MKIDFIQVFIDNSREWHSRMHYSYWNECNVNDCVLARSFERKRKINKEPTTDAPPPTTDAPPPKK